MESQIANTLESWRQTCSLSIWPYCFAGLWSFTCSERINILDTFVTMLESLEQGGAIDPFSPSASFYHHLCQVYWCGWQRTPLRWLMNKPMIIFNNRKAWGLGKILTVGGITKSLHRKSLVILLLWVTHDTRRTCVRVELGLTP